MFEDFSLFSGWRFQGFKFLGSLLVRFLQLTYNFGLTSEGEHDAHYGLKQPTLQTHFGVGLPV